jgi:hypothetical protein
MSWLRLDDQIGNHPKTMAAENEAFGAWVRMVAHCGAYLTDGFVTDAVAIAIAGKRKVLDRLVAVGFLDRVEAGYAVHDYLDWNPAGSKVREERRVKSERKAAAGRLGGQRSGEARRNQMGSNGEANGEANAKQIEAPSPSPSPHKQNPSHTDPDQRDLTGSDREQNGPARANGTTGIGVRS